MLEEIAREPYEPRGILNSEMALVIYAALAAGVEVFIETGRARGQSTYMLAKYLPEVEIHSVELRDTPDEAFARTRLAGFGNVTLHMGHAEPLVSALVSRNAHRRMAILCDGPKGAAAVSILEHNFHCPNVLVGFIHDMRRLDHGAPSPHRACAIERLPHHKFSDDPKLVAGTSWMDAEVVKAGGPCGPQWEAVHGSYGPTIGVFFNTQADRKAA